MPRKFGDATTDLAVTNFKSQASKRSFTIWAYRTGTGGNANGRMFDKAGAGGSPEVLATTATTYSYARGWTGAGSWTVPIPSVNAWHHVAVVYDSALTSNVPKIYIDGVLQTVTTTAPTGTIINTADPYCIGNRFDKVRNWAGHLAHFCINDVLLTPGEVRDAMRNGYTPRGLRVYYPLDATSAPELDIVASGGVALLTGTKPSGLFAPVVTAAVKNLPRRVVR